MSYMTKGELAQFQLPELRLVEARMRRLLQVKSPHIQQMGKYILSLGGKRIRPLLVLLSSSLAPAALSRRVDTATAAEMIHTASLLHDDVIDEADMRRGRQSVNSRWGNPASILAGDFLFARAFSLLNPYRHELKVMSNAIASMCQGELIQLQTHFDSGITPEIYLKTIAGKTASLLAACCRCGAIICNLPRPAQDALGRFGLCFGIAYQLVDDISDYGLDATQTGKPSGNDIGQGIMTLPVLYLLANPQYSQNLRQMLATGTVHRQQLGSWLEQAGALAKAAAVAEEYLDHGIAQLQRLPEGSGVKRLVALAELLRQRCARFS